MDKPNTHREYDFSFEDFFNDLIDGKIPEIFKKGTMLSGIKPSGSLTLGNYIGAIKPFVSYQDEYKLYVFIADLHALTLPIKPEELKENSLNLIAVYLAAGLDPNKAVLFKQSDIPAHNQLEWILTCNSVLRNFLEMNQYKMKASQITAHEGIPTGILMYPSLMAADILLYDTDFVPVGIDQMQHVELTHDLAKRFNNVYGETFKLPKPIISKTGAKIMSLSNPTKKMSKSESDKGTIYLLDDIEITHKKIMKAVTDAESKIYYDPEKKPGISNLLSIYAGIKDISIEEAVNTFKDEKDYGVFKRAVSKVVCDECLRIQEQVKSLKENKDQLNKILENGAKIAQEKANLKISEIYSKIGLKF